MATLADVVVLTEERCPGGAALPGVAATSKYVAAAVARLNDVRPRSVKLQIVGDGTDEYSLGDEYTEDSAITRVRFVPAGDFDQAADWLQGEDYEAEYARGSEADEDVGLGDGSTRTFPLSGDHAIDGLSEVTVNSVAVDADEYEIRSGDGGSLLEFETPPGDGLAIVATYYTAPSQIRFFTASPGASDLVIVEFTAPHVLTEEGTTIGAADQPFLADLAASLKLEAAAIACLSLTPQDTEEDLADYDKGSRADALQRAAKLLRDRFNVHFGISTGGAAAGEEAPATMAFADVDTPPSSTTRYRHTHPRREF